MNYIISLINRLQRKLYVHLNKYRKFILQNSIPIHYKNSHQKRNRREFLQPDNGHLHRSKANIILGSERAIRREQNKDICSHFDIVLEVQARAVRQIKEITQPDRKRRSKFLIHRWHNPVYRKSKESTIKLLELICEYEFKITDTWSI